MDESRRAALRAQAIAANASASEIRNRFRRRVEERTLRVNTALAKFRSVTEGTP